MCRPGGGAGPPRWACRPARPGGASTKPDAAAPTTKAASTASCWHTIPGQRQPVMIWPLWRQPLDTHGIQTLLEHPQLRPRHTPQGITLDRRPWPPLGVFAVAAATRQPIEGRKSAGVLTPTPILTTD
ncbi:type I-G CRISPR-associated protein, Cas3-extension family [Plantactinospora mayteni]|uniref:type I-G CRISPR-associated protein, Cas3-extension family n=1 Tax=Plantactinospora mayteni TaxID=566021 RepID=UPI003CD09330